MKMLHGWYKIKYNGLWHKSYAERNELGRYETICGKSYKHQNYHHRTTPTSELCPCCEGAINGRN